MNLASLRSIPLPSFKLVRDILTDDAGNFVPDKVLFVLLTLVFAGLAIWSVAVLKHAFDPVAYGAGAAATLGGGGGAGFLMSRMQSNKPDAPQ